MKLLRKLLVKSNLISTEFIEDLFIYLDEKNNPTKEITDKVKFLGEVKFKCKLNKLDEVAENYISEKYPNLKGLVYHF